MCSLFGFWGDDLLAPVKAALRADLVEENRVAAVSALYDRRSGQLHVHGTTSTRSRLRSPKFRYSHDITSFALSFAQYNWGQYTNLQILSRAEPFSSAHQFTSNFNLVEVVRTVFPVLFAPDLAQCREEAFSIQAIRARRSNSHPRIRDWRTR